MTRSPNNPQSATSLEVRSALIHALQLDLIADRVLGVGVAFSMDGRGRFLDNIFIERLWRSLKYEAVYLPELRDGLDAEGIVGSWIDFYNEVRPHSSLGGRTPGETYRNGARAA